MNTSEHNPYQVGQPKDKEEKVEDVVAKKGIMFKETKDETYFRSYSAHTKCKNCSHEGPSHVDHQCNLTNFLFAYCCGGWWFLYMIYKNHDLNCKDAHHKCAGCNKVLYEYKAC